MSNTTRTLDEFMTGNAEPVKESFSHREDVTLANLYIPVGRGWDQVAQRLERAAPNFRDGEVTSFEPVAKYVTPELAYLVRVERAKVGGREDIAPIALRVTMIFRPEDSGWKVVHRHADPIITAQQAESILRE